MYIYSPGSIFTHNSLTVLIVTTNTIVGMWIQALNPSMAIILALILTQSFMAWIHYGCGALRHCSSLVVPSMKQGETTPHRHMQQGPAMALHRTASWRNVLDSAQ